LHHDRFARKAFDYGLRPFAHAARCAVRRRVAHEGAFPAAVGVREASGAKLIRQEDVGGLGGGGRTVGDVEAVMPVGPEWLPEQSGLCAVCDGKGCGGGAGGGPQAGGVGVEIASGCG
jgi:hypothetical protein